MSWSLLWQLPLSLEKCNVLTFHSKCNPVEFDYTLANHPLVRMGNVIYLGILMASKLHFSAHITNLCNTARSRTAIVLKCFQSRDCHLLYKAFITYVRPLLEYCSSVWSPYRLEDIRKIESIQRKFTKSLRGLGDLSYEQRLTVLKSETLEIRRIKADLKMYYNILHNLV